MKKQTNEYTDEEAAKRAEDAIRRSFSMPHTPNKSLVGTTQRAKARAKMKPRDTKKG